MHACQVWPQVNHICFPLQHQVDGPQNHIELWQIYILILVHWSQLACILSYGSKLLLTKMTVGMLDLKLILEFDGLASKPSVVEEMEKSELVCKICYLKQLEHSLLKADRWYVSSLPTSWRKEDFSQTKSALYIAFATDVFLAYEQFTEWCLHPGESVDISRVMLWRLSFVW